MVLKRYTTLTGSYYDIDEVAGYWTKNGGRGNFLESVCGLTPEEIKGVNTAGDLDGRAENLGYPPIEIGKKIYITSREVWWLSTNVVSIEDTAATNSTETGTDD